MKMKAIRFYAPGDIRYEETELPELKNGEIRVKIKAALTCGTDLKTYRRGHPVIIKSVPCGLGHEFSGVVDSVAEGVTSVKVGDRVVCANSAPCGECFYCKKGNPNLCENIEFLNGAYAEYINVPARIVEKNTYLLPENTDFESAAFSEPLANVVHGIELTDVRPGQTVCVYGVGTIGLMFVRLAKLKGARVIAAGRNPLKLKLAKEFGGADEVVDLKSCDNPVKTILDLTEGGHGVDAAIECVGLPETWELMFKLVRKGGTINLFGGCKGGTSITVDTKRLHYDQLKVIGVFHHTPKYFKQAFELICDGKLDVKKLVTMTMPLEKTRDALEAAGAGEAVKVLIKP